jgi:hypothetical protein
MSNNSFLRQTATTIVFIDASLSDYQTLQAGIVEGVKSVIISPNQDGIEQISQVLQQHPHITTIHILSHGAPGCLYLGNSQLNLTNIHNSPNNYNSGNLRIFYSMVVTSLLGTLGQNLFTNYIKLPTPPLARQPQKREMQH